jgi:hypothetical protein
MVRTWRECHKGTHRAIKRITNTDHSHLIVPGIGLAFFASKPQARTCPSSLYNKQVGILRKVSKDPGQWSICCTCPAAIRDDPYALRKGGVMWSVRAKQRAVRMGRVLTMPEKVVPMKLKWSENGHGCSKEAGIDVPKSIETESFPSSVGMI